MAIITNLFCVLTFCLLSTGLFENYTEEIIILQTETVTPIATILPGSVPTERNSNNPMMTNNANKLLANNNMQGIITRIYL